MPSLQSRTIETAAIYVDKNRRGLDEKVVESLMESIKLIGLQQPITVRECSVDEWEGGYILVAGRHRLEACDRLDLNFIDAVITEWNETEARLWEISENLHRAELTALERADQIAEWVELVTRKIEVSAQLGPKPRRGGRPKGGERAAARELGVERKEVTRALDIAGITTEAKDAAHNAGLSDNQSALLKIAKTDKDQQVAKVEEIKKKKDAANMNRKARKVDPEQAFDKWMETGLKWFSAGSEDWRARALSLLRETHQNSGGQRVPTAAE